MSYAERRIGDDGRPGVSRNASAPPIAAWIVKHVDHIDTGDAVGAARGRTVFQLTLV